MRETRTTKSLKNAQVAFLFFIINLLLNFVSRKIFIDYLGLEILGLNTTAVNLLSFLNLAELGIGSAISYTLYKPLAAKDYHVANEVISVQGFLYRLIAGIVILASCVLMLFFPLIFKTMQLPLWYAYASFAVLLFSSLLGYFYNYKQIILVADQNEYKLTRYIQTIKVIKIGLQIVTIKYGENGYIWWLVWEFVFTLITAVGINYVIKKHYPWLVVSPAKGKRLRNEYKDVMRKTKQLFFHKISGFVSQQSSPLIVYAFTSLGVVAVYGNYLLIITSVTLLIGTLFNSIGAGVGHLVSEGNKKRIDDVFWELFSSRFLVTATVCYVAYMLVNPFMELWIGKEYIIDRISLVFLLIGLFIQLQRTAIDNFINAYGLFQDVWSTIVSAAMDIVCSIGGGYFWGLPGILGGLLVSRILIVCGWKPYFLFHYGFNKTSFAFWKYAVAHILLAGITFYGSKQIMTVVPLNPSDSYSQLILYGCITFLMYGSITGLWMLIAFPSLRRFRVRLINLVRK